MMHSQSTTHLRRLFLVRLSLSLVPCTLVTSTLVSGLGACLTQSGVLALVVLLELAGLDLGEAVGGRGELEGSSDGAGSVLGNGGLLALLGHNDDAGLVGLEALDVAGEGLLGKVLAAEVDGDTDGGGEGLGDTGGLYPGQSTASCISQRASRFFGCSSRRCRGRWWRVEMYLELSQGETPTSADLAVVLDGRASDNGSQEVDGARGNLGGLGATSDTARSLLAGLYSICQNQIPSKFLIVVLLRRVEDSFPPPELGVPGRSGSEPDVANPCGNLHSLQSVSMSIAVACSIGVFDVGRA